MYHPAGGQACPATTQIRKNHGKVEGHRAVFSIPLSLPAFFVVVSCLLYT